MRKTYSVKLKQFKILAETIRRACRVRKGLVVSPTVQRRDVKSAATGKSSLEFKCPVGNCAARLSESLDSSGQEGSKVLFTTGGGYHSWNGDSRGAGIINQFCLPLAFPPTDRMLIPTDSDDQSKPLELSTIIFAI